MRVLIKLILACRSSGVSPGYPKIKSRLAIKPLALAIAEKIVSHEIKINKEVVLNVAKAALKKVVDTRKIKIRVASTDFQFLKDFKPELLDIQDKLENITLEEDSSITGGGCVIETNLGDVDARIEEQLKVVRESFSSEVQKISG